MGLRLHLDPQRSDRLAAHLGQGDDEQLAFLLATIDGDDAWVSDIRLIEDVAFELQTPWHLGLDDEALGDVIRWAHRSSSTLIEAHVHRDGDPAHFSWSDWAGLDAFVPHVYWRLRHRPYIALVFAETTFDGLVWRADAITPEPLESLLVTDEPARLPTALSRRPAVRG
jgi:hypothetical protein